MTSCLLFRTKRPFQNGIMGLLLNNMLCCSLKEQIHSLNEPNSIRRDVNINMTDFGYKFKLRKGTDKQTQCQECETMDTFR